MSTPMLFHSSDFGHQLFVHSLVPYARAAAFRIAQGSGALYRAQLLLDDLDDGANLARPQMPTDRWMPHFQAKCME
eukprot:9494078-Pyramimonas_sp.AAC.1